MPDLIILFPWGALTLFYRPLSILYAIKVIRIKKLNGFLDRKFINPIIRKIKEDKVASILKDESKKNDILFDHIKILHYLYISYLIRIFKVCIQLFLLGYFLGIFWYYYIYIRSMISTGLLSDDDADEQ